MDIAIIGAGNVGRSLATAFVRAGHTVAITSHDPDDAGAVAAATGATFSASNREAASAASVVVLAVPFSSAADIAAEIGEVVSGKVVIDATNRMSFGADGPDIDTALVQCRGTRGAASRRGRRQGVQHAVRLAPGRPDRRGRPARWLRGRR